MLRLVTIALIPVVLILAYVYHRDKYNKEPWWLLLFSLIGGALVVPPIIWWETGMLNIMPEVETVNQYALYVSFAVAGLCEETSKYLVLLMLVYRSTHFNEKFDGIIYAVFVSMGFALVENIMYVVSGGEGVGLTRALTAVPAHAIFAIAMGFHLARAKFSARKRYRHFALALLVPITLHGTYNYIIMSETNYLLFTFVFYVFLLYRLGFKRMRSSIRNSAYRK
ncbi:MAG: PrsW family glutamic-type intramembrane protease [Bacteroidales bacterium]|jgi:RsiW-degrading membrane proteinase PrsW (M82 family)|nr:PrsW family glutamic-type intramembrane protease [Bacteroidales bacterium]